MAAEPPASIRQFLDQVTKDLDFLVNRVEKIIPGYQSPIYESLQTSWKYEVKEQLDEVITAVEVVDTEVLENHGLGSRQRQFAFKTYAFAQNREGLMILQDNWEAIENIPDAVRKRLAVPTIDAYLGSVEAVLDSIVKAVPGVGEGIIEFKEMIHELISS